MGFNLIFYTGLDFLAEKAIGGLSEACVVRRWPKRGLRCVMHVGLAPCSVMLCDARGFGPVQCDAVMHVGLAPCSVLLCVVSPSMSRLLSSPNSEMKLDTPVVKAVPVGCECGSVCFSFSSGRASLHGGNRPLPCAAGGDLQILGRCL